MFIEVHLLQSFAPSNLNRDDTNAPKDCEFGGVRRARISSQCIKRSIRMHPAFEKATGVEPATRTRLLNRELKRTLVEAGKEEAQVEAVLNAFHDCFVKIDKEHRTVLLYVTNTEIEMLKAQLLAKWTDIFAALKEKENPALDALVKTFLKEVKKRTSAPDIALFGRMVAEKPDLNIDAACQVAHAISTHRVSMEMDFYTAADDLAREDESGAGMMGVTGFNSACFYRYARIDWEQLVSNLGADRALAKQTVEGFLRAVVAAIPTGKQNSFAAQNPPSLLMIVVRKDGQGWSLANAFEKPVTASREGGFITPSIKALDTHWGKLVKVYGDKDTHVFVLAIDSEEELVSLKDHQVSSLDEWIDQTLQLLPS